VRKDGEGCVLVDPLPGESRGVTVDTEHTVYKLLSFLLLGNLEKIRKRVTYPTLVAAKYSKIPCETSIHRLVQPGHVSCTSAIKVFPWSMHQLLSLILCPARSRDTHN
jgi:hypothetical protein